MEQEKEREIKEYKKDKVFPVNNLDSAWQSAIPDFSSYQNRFRGNNSKFVDFFSIFSSNMRLSNITTTEAEQIEYDIITSSIEHFHNLPKCFHDTNVKISALLEPRQSRKGFRTEWMNKVSQDVRQTMTTNQNSKGLFGGEIKNDN